MNFIEYCELPENKAWITQMMWNMKLDTGFDEIALADAVMEQAEDENVSLTIELSCELSTFFAEWYDELDDAQDALRSKRGAV